MPYKANVSSEVTMPKCKGFWMISLSLVLLVGTVQADEGTVTLITAPGGPYWGYSVSWVSGNLDTVMFYPLCDGATGARSGAAQAAGWLIYNGGGVLGVPDDTVRFIRPNALTGGSEDTLWVVHAFCDVYTYYNADDGSGIVEGPAPADYDDLPAPYQTYIAQNGPRHFETGYEWLGSCVTIEEQPIMVCMDTCEWGVNIPTDIQPCPTVSWMEIIVNTSGLGTARYWNDPDHLLYFHAWIDWTHDFVSGEGDFADSLYCPAFGMWTYEHLHWLNAVPFIPLIVNGSGQVWVNGPELAILPQTPVMTIMVPFLAGPNTPYGSTYARYRLGYGPDRLAVSSPVGKALYGEVEGSCCELQLPVELTSFEGVGEDNQVRLTWTTASELENDRFVIRRALNVDGPYSNWVEIPGSGTTSGETNYEYIDTRVVNNVTYYYRLRDIDINGRITEHDITVTATPRFDNPDPMTIDSYKLYQNVPNPFNPTTIITYDIAEAGMVSLKVFNIEGREVATLVNDVQDQDRYTVTFDVKNLASGIYFYRLETSDFIATKKMVVIK